jgi:ABC-type multidrug transport system ATPase subunit
MLEVMGLPRGSQPAAQLSVGNQQRLNIGIGLLGDPDVLLLDEPTASLDPQQRRRLWRFLVERLDRGCAVLMATHVFEEVAGVASRVLLLIEGRVVQAGAPAEVAASLAEPEVE